jgi:photosystem II stability/assembly factor-like uncharacterized protein
VVCLLAATPSVASAESWVAVGPPGGDVRCLAGDPRSPRVVYLGTSDGVLYRSDDAGLRWRRLTPGFPMRGRSLDDIVVDRDGVVLVGYWEVAGTGGGVARSADGGRTFEILPGMDGQGVRALAVAPSNPRSVVAGTLSGAFRSDDGGRSWRRITPQGHDDLRNVDSVAFDPVDPDVIYVGTWHLPWKTVDGGRFWREVKLGMIEDSDVMTLTVDRQDPQRVYATACTGIYRSLDGAARWSKLRGIPSESRRTRAFALDPTRSGGLYAGTTLGVWSSEDNGTSWQLVTSRSLVINSIVVLPDGTVLLGCDGAGVLRSGDHGRSWAASNDGFSARFVSRMVFDRDGKQVLAGILGDRTHGGVLVAPEPAGPWRPLGSGLEGREVFALAMAGRQPLAGTDDGVYAWVADAVTPVEASTNGGGAARLSSGAWARLATVVDGLDAHPRVADLVSLPGRVLIAATPQGLLRTRDGGQSWSRLELGLARAVSALAVIPGESRGVLAATPLGLYESHDAGSSWTQVSRGLGDASIHALAFLPGSDTVVFATTPSGLLKSSDRGRTWQRRGGGLPYSDITGLALHPDGRTVYASDFARGGVFKSGDAGDSWTPLPTDGLASDRVWALALDPASPGRLLAASPTGGLHLLSLLPPAVHTGTP